MRATLSPEAVQAAQLLVGAVLPVVVALATKRLAASSVKAWTLAALAAVTAVSSQLLAPDGFVVADVAAGFVRTMVAGVALHYGLLKPTGVTGSDGVVAEATATVGIGEEAKPPKPTKRAKARAGR